VGSIVSIPIVPVVVNVLALKVLPIYFSPWNVARPVRPAL